MAVVEIRLSAHSAENCTDEQSHPLVTPMRQRKKKIAKNKDQAETTLLHSNNVAKKKRGEIS